METATLITIVLFFLGYFLTVYFAYYQENIRLLVKEGFIITEIEKTREALKNQIHGLNQLVYLIDSESYRNLFVEPALRSNIIISNQEDLYKIIFRRKRGNTIVKQKVYNDLIRQNYLIDSILNETIRICEKEDDKLLGYEKSLDDTGTQLYQIFIEIEQKDNKLDIEKDILKIHNKFLQNDESNSRKKVYEKISLPLENLLIENKFSYKKSEDIFKITSTHNKDYVYFSKSLSMHSMKIREYSSSLHYTYNSLDMLLNDFKKMKTIRVII
jgi:hypothetical protein